MLRTFVIAVLAVGLAGPAAAAKGGKGKGKAKGKEGRPAAVMVKDKGKRDTVVVFTDRDRGAVRTYWIDTYGHGKCPPGLAKKHNGCLPPGQAKKRYVVGRRLPATVVYEPLPPVLVTRLGPAPRGYEYVVVDGDVLKLALGTRLVADAIRGIVD
jgi:hypothetical protein